MWYWKLNKYQKKAHEVLLRALGSRD